MELLEYNLSADEPLYVISVVSKIVELPVWTLRALDREGMVCPRRTAGKNRLYSKKDIMKLLHIRDLMKERGVNISGIRVILEIEGRFSISISSFEER